MYPTFRLSDKVLLTECFIRGVSTRGAFESSMPIYLLFFEMELIAFFQKAGSNIAHGDEETRWVILQSFAVLTTHHMLKLTVYVRAS